MCMVHILKRSTKTKVICKHVIVLPDEEYRKQRPYDLVFCCKNSEVNSASTQFHSHHFLL